MNKLFFTHGFDFHKNTIGIASGFILTDSKGLKATRRAMMNNIKVGRRIGFEKVKEKELRLEVLWGFVV